MCNSHSLSQFVNIATLNGRTLDLVLSNEESLIENLEVCSPIGGSDHASIIFAINAHILKDEAITRRDFGKANYENIVCHLASIDWLGSLNCASTVDAKYELFLGILMDCIERYVPLVEKSLGGSALPPYLANLTQRRERAWHKARMTKNSADEREFERLNRKLEKKLKKFNTSVEKKVINSENKAAFFKLLKSRLTLKTKATVLVSPSGTPVYDDKDKVELLASTFQENFCCHHRAIEELLPQETKFAPMSDSVWFYRDEILELLLKWPESNALTPDLIPLHFIKRVAHCLAGPLEYIFNLSFMNAEVPRRWTHCAFADDLKLYHSIAEDDDARELQEALSKVEKWSEDWDLPLSETKTSVLHLGKRSARYTYEIKNTALKTVDKECSSSHFPPVVKN
ncbi:hypothetical protein COOONC_21100 [Cooperia oncophora]